MSSVISICRVSIGRVHRLSKPLVRSVSSRATERDSLLRRVYAPFEQLDRHSIEYEQLARSGKVWEEYFQPGDSDRYRYIDLQQVNFEFNFRIIKIETVNHVSVTPGPSARSTF